MFVFLQRIHQSLIRLSSASQQQSLRLPGSSNMSAGGVSALTPLPPELRKLLRLRLGALETQLLRKVAELEEEKGQLYNETAAHRQRTETALNSLMERITELEKSKILTSLGAEEDRSKFNNKRFLGPLSGLEVKRFLCES